MVPAPIEGLESIDLSRWAYLETSTITSTSLKRIDLEQCLHLKVLSIYSPNLKELDILLLPLLMMIVVWCPSLVRLNLPGCCDIEGKTSVVKCYRLEYLTPEFFRYPITSIVQRISRYGLHYESPFSSMHSYSRFPFGLCFRETLACASTWMEI